MKTKKTQTFLADHGITMLVADKTKPAPEIDELLRELGNGLAAIPFYAIYPGDGRPPIIFSDAPLLQQSLLKRLEAAVTPASIMAKNEQERAASSM